MEKTEATSTRKTQVKKSVTKKQTKAAPAAEAKQSETEIAPAVKSAVITGANPDVKFYRISDDLPVYLL